MITKVLVAVDGSECANRALDFALEVAEKFSAPLTILNVFELPVYSTPEEPLAVSVGVTGFVNDLRRIHAGILSKAAEKASTLKPNLKIATELREGNPSSQIIAAASQGNFDIVVLGHSGAGRLKEMFLGGTSERVAHLARCPVLIVK